MGFVENRVVEKRMGAREVLAGLSSALEKASRSAWEKDESLDGRIRLGYFLAKVEEVSVSLSESDGASKLAREVLLVTLGHLLLVLADRNHFKSLLLEVNNLVGVVEHVVCPLLVGGGNCVFVVAG